MNIEKKWFLEKISFFLTNDESNKMTKVDNSLMFDPEVLVGFVSGNDEIFDEYKKIIGKFHLTPREVFNWYCEKNDITPSYDDLTVVVYILPINQNTKKENFEFSQEMPSERWANTRLFGEKSNELLQRFLVSELESAGIPAVAPITENSLFQMLPKYGDGVWASTWSHRHMAFAAGLGSFGLSDGFINEKGIAMRCGSIVVNYKLPSDAHKRPKDPYYYCTKCGKCVERCPARAISLEKGHNKEKCAQHVFSSVPFVKKYFKINIYSCGLCQVGVPCENGIPK
ncbi:MAG: epoxyqueuosine reductase [Candidatus Lokiarchaeota archaeon]|nr:epoxyqueuosine reductase [Candidatus Lokiarchaeota archaeon]